VAEKPHDAVVKFDTYRNLQRHRAVLPALARFLVRNGNISQRNTLCAATLLRETIGSVVTQTLLDDLNIHHPVANFL